ncbi:MAG: hypothetical protein HZA74_12930 [Ignavibacteriales bacterium]|nr:hypothetical protein [Ignavibacteriales bacterium]
MKPALSILLIVVTIVSLSCQHTTEPELQPGRRDYVWTADTIEIPFDSFVSIWGASPSDVWVGGFQTNDLYHFNGVKWEKWKEQISTTSTALWGLSNNIIWRGGNDGNIWYYNGYKWEENFVYKNVNYLNATIEDFYGSVYNDIYAVGYLTKGKGDLHRGFILHYNGIQWKEVYVADYQSQFVRIRKQENKYYIESFTINNETGNDTIVFYEFDGKKLKNIFTKSLTEITFATFNTIGEELYFLINTDVYIYQKETFIKRFSLNVANFGYQIYGRSEKDLFVRMKNGLGHYNGIDIEYLYRFDNNWTSISANAAIFEKDIFFTVEDPINDKDFIIHGKIKNKEVVEQLK